jgi:hypothetical protein
MLNKLKLAAIAAIASAAMALVAPASATAQTASKASAAKDVSVVAKPANPAANPASAVRATAAPAKTAQLVGAAQAAVEVPVLVKPPSPPANANELPEDISKAITAFVEALGGQVENLKLRETAVALCWQTHQGANKSSPGDTEFYECLAKAAAETGAIWESNIETLRQFNDELKKIHARASESKSFAAAQERQFAQEYLGKMKQVGTARARLELAQAAIARGQVMSPEQAAELRMLADDLSTSFHQATLLKRQRTYYKNYGEIASFYTDKIKELSIEASVFQHFAGNRRVVWNSIIKTIETEATMSNVIGQFDRLREMSERKLFPTLNALKEFGEIKMPQMPQMPDAPAQGNWKMPPVDLPELIKSVLDRTRDQ